MRTLAPGMIVLALFGGPAVARDPDLVIDAQQLASFWYIEERYFPPGHCALVEGCVDAPGVRKLLRFRTTTANISRVDLALGDPTGNPLFVYSPCHGHYHFEDYAAYRLKNLGGAVVAPGHKQAFCLEDTFQYLFANWVEPTRLYDCALQGIQAGWSDVYGAGLDCQWIDITDVPRGDYVLENEVNPAHVLAEADYGNNVASVPVQVTDAPGIAHRPDGAIVPGTQMRVGRQAGLERLLYDVQNCPAEDYNVLFGWAPVESYAYAGAVCHIGTTGDAVVGLPDPPPGAVLWWTVVGVEPSTLPQTEGGHGFDSTGKPRPLSGAGFCGVTTTAPRVYCSN